MDIDEFLDDIFSSRDNIQPGADSTTNHELIELLPAEVSLDDYPEINYNDVITVASFGDEPTRIVTSPSLIPSPDQTPVGAESPGTELLAVTIPLTHVVQPAIASWRSSSCLTADLESSPSSKKRQQSGILLAQKRKSDYGCNSRRLSVGSQPSLLPFSISGREEHVMRERKRRDEMAERFLLLEKILPPQPRRQKVVIVEDTIKLVKNLQHRKNELLKRRAQLQNPKIKTVISCQSDKGSYGPSHVTLEPELTMLRPDGKKLRPVDAFREDSCRDDGDVDGDELFQIHAHVSADEVLVEMTFRRGSPHLHRRVMQTVESVKLEVVHASMQKSVATSCGFVEFIITAKPPVELCPSHHQDIQSSGRLLVAALQAAFTH